MRNVGRNFIQAVLLVSIMVMTGCGTSQQAYQGAFNNQTALTNNQKTYTQPPDAVFKIVKQTFIHQGFTVENADTKSGVIKAVRNMQDKEDPEISYNIHASADVSDIGNSDTNVSLSSSQQTILHRSTTTWWHLLWILPIIPTGTEYQTLVIKEGNITDPQYYTDFFNTLTVSVTKYEQAVKIAAAKAAAKAEADRIVAERIAAEKAAAVAKAAAEKAELDRIAAVKAAKLKADAEAKAAAKAREDQIAAEKAAEKAVADKVAADKAAAEQEAAKVAAELKKAEADAAAAAASKKKKKKIAQK